jgi:hypothetical protein
MITGKKKSKIQLAREIIANLRRDMHRPATPKATPLQFIEAEPFMPMPMASSSSNRTHRPRPIQAASFSSGNL